MKLPADVARCNGMPWDPFGVMPECLECRRYLAAKHDDGTRWYPYMQAPQKMPCLYLLRDEQEKP